MKQVMALAVVFTLLGVGAAQAQAPAATPAKTARKKASAQNAAVAQQLSELKQALDAQQQQIKQLSDQIQSRDQQIQQLQQSIQQNQTAASAAASKADEASSQSAKQDEAVNALRDDVKDLKQNSTNTAVALQETQTNFKKEMESPISIHYKGITITPGGFIEAATVWRQHAMASDINTPFNSIPMPGAPQNHMSEFFGSGRQSRLSLLAEGKVSIAKLTGYYEMDWLSAGVTSNNNQSNSYTQRQRQIWGQAAFNDGIAVTAGQMWSLVTETRKGLDNRTEALPMTIDPQYHVGFSWMRQYGFRLTKNFGNKFWLGASVENAQTTFGGSGQSNFVLGSAGTGGGLYNPTANYSFNSSPDFVFKAAFEPGIGHYEVFGVVRRFRDRVYPNATATPASVAGAYNFATTVGGYGANARVSVFNKHVDIGVHGMAGDGMGRYGTSSLPDVTVNGDGTLAPLKAVQGLGTLEIHTAKLDWYFNGGAEFIGKNVSPLGGKLYGYGLPNANNSGCGIETLPGGGGFAPGAVGSCSANTRNVIQGTTGFWYRFYKGPKGTAQFGTQYSYLVRNTWAGVGGPSFLGQPAGIQNMVLTSFRYVLP
jgi:hypothetical protein